MGFRSPTYCGRRQKVRVVTPNGQLRRFPCPITVPELLHLYPHHYVRLTAGPILAAEAELDGGATYVLLPLPRLFPQSSSSSSSCEEEWKGVKRLRDSNPRRQAPPSPSREGYNRKRKAGRRRKMWEPSLDMISENAILLQTKKEEEKLSEKKFYKPSLKQRLENYTFRKDPWYMQTRLTVSIGFIF